jgi:hypothetical protein
MPAVYKEKRRHPRFPCDAGVEVRPEGGKFGNWGTLADISIGGCYIYTFSPLPIDTVVALNIKARDTEIAVTARTVTFHPGVGMGVEFKGFLQEDGEARLKKLLTLLEHEPKHPEKLEVIH